MAKLTKGEIQGIRLIADVYVLNDLMENVFGKEECFVGRMDGLRSHVNKACPKFQLAQEELQKQIQNVRKVWINELANK
ncbi:hypothetical protein VVYB158_15305 [Vibrio vulnificus CladeA-yb158]|uniref:hypothetical protein n=1 Tax=Vibrio vulnificus TaxID=672 RepID=UPI00063D87B8|nr:hypothetical protein [Vibrio vulnificus]KLI66938.1 hypothetical protein VVYB158_15305 [Vibrio vulnificus CladeA-yb158]